MPTTVYVPHDVESALVAWLYSKGIDARTEVPLTRAPGMVRLQRVGGDVGEGGAVDRPEVAVESWGADQPSSFDQARRIFALFTAAEGLQDLGNGLIISAAGASPPVSFEDELAPELHRHIVNVSLVCHMDTQEV